MRRKSPRAGDPAGPAPADYLKQAVAEIKKLEPDVLVPMHCRGLKLTMEAPAQMPHSVISTSTGSKLIFSASLRRAR